MRNRIAMVSQRYGLEVNGGAELLCRQLAEKLTAYYDVTVYTSCAIDYITWKNEYPQGVETINGVRVIRYPVSKQRNQEQFNEISVRVFSKKHRNKLLEKKWIDEQGPYCPELTEYLLVHYTEYDAVLFMTYLYYISAVCLSDRKIKNAILIPTAHDEPPIYLNYYKKVFRNAKGLIYNTIEEKAFVENHFHTKKTPNIITGVGIDFPDEIPESKIKEKFKLDSYILYVGRIDESKGCKKLFTYFQSYKKRNSGNLKLALIGKSVMAIPNDEDIVSLGFVSDEDKFGLIKNSRCLVLASEFESLSIVVLESMALGVPVLVNGNCDVLKGHCVRSNAGLYFTNFFEFEKALNFIQDNQSVAEIMGRNGITYINVNYQWECIIGKMISLINEIAEIS